MPVKKKKSRWRPFDEAVEFVRKLELDGYGEWEAYCKGELPEKGVKPNDIPSDPRRSFKSHWISYGHWLGTGTIATSKRKFRSFKKAREFARTLNLRSLKEWNKYYTGKINHLPPKPDDIPTAPNKTYKNKGWVCWADFLGYESAPHVLKQWRTFEEARDFARKLALTPDQWRKYCKGEMPEIGTKPDDIPVGVDSVYKDKGWISWTDFLYPPGKRPKEFRSYKEARKFCRTLGITATRWMDYCTGRIPDLPPKPNDIPSTPQNVYIGKGWKSWKDFLIAPVSKSKKVFRSFDEARQFCRSLRLESSQMWNSYCRGELEYLGTRPDDIPSSPRLAYPDQWIDWYDWLDLDRNKRKWKKTVVKMAHRKFRSFEDAREFARNLGLKSHKQWKEYINGQRPDLPKLPADVPSRPNVSYRYSGWSGYKNFLGVEPKDKRKKNWRSFKNARDFARSLKMHKTDDWKAYCAGEVEIYGVKPEDIPRNPDVVYRGKGWISWMDWFGNGVVFYQGKEYAPFIDARKFANNLGLKSVQMWFDFCNIESRLPDDVPVFPYQVYKGYGWVSWSDWLGLRKSTPGKSYDFRSYEDAREFVRGLKLKKNKDWRKYIKGEMINRPSLPDDIPKSPEVRYRNSGWQGWGDFLGTGNIPSSKREFIPFEKARDFASSLGLKSGTEWVEYCRGDRSDLPIKPENIPTNPHRTYKSQWQGMGDWLGTGNIRRGEIKYRSYGQAEKFVQKLGIKTAKEWRAYCRGDIPKLGKRPEDVPANPERIYYWNGWVNWGTFFGTGRKLKGNFLSFNEAREYCRKLGLSSVSWRKYSKGEIPGLGKRPEFIPANPSTIYKNKGWVNWSDFLGTDIKK